MTEARGAIDPVALGLLQGFARGIITNRDPNQRIIRNGSPYLDRYMLGRKMHVPTYDNPNEDLYAQDWMPSEIENIYIHHFIRPDRDDPHNHPWDNVTIVINGWYDEDCFDLEGRNPVRKRRNPGDLVVRSAAAIHAIVDTSPDCTTLFMSSPKSQDWGFLVNGSFVRWQDYERNSVA